MHDNTRGGNDTLIGGANSNNTLIGDARFMDGDAHGGNDTLIGGVGSINFLNSDALSMSGNARGGDDTLIGADGATFNFFLGDSSDMHDNARGGNDTEIGGANTSNTLIGDAFNMFDNSRGGNDTLVGGGAGSDNSMHGDAFFMFGNARGGNDTLISGPGADHMWGDAQVINGVAASPTAPTGSVVTGADTFVFAPGSGNDDINDFRQSDHDRIDVRAYGFHTLADMTITADGIGNTRIAFDANDGVTVVGISDPHILHASDFLLV
jgi:serralysin